MHGTDRSDHRLGDVVGTIRHRLLISNRADPAEVASRLPAGLRPLVGPSGGVVVGCCLISLESVRPWPVPGLVGVSVRAAAHRIAVEVGPAHEPVRAVYVPIRHTNSLATVAAGGRIFPGKHRRSTIESSCTDDAVSWLVRAVGDEQNGDGFSISASASRVAARPTESEVADIVIGTKLGLSPDHRDRLEAADLVPFDRRAEEIDLIDLESAFLDGFRTAEPAETLLMTDVGFHWRPATVPTAQEASPCTTTPSTIVSETSDPA